MVIWLRTITAKQGTRYRWKGTEKKLSRMTTTAGPNTYAENGDNGILNRTNCKNNSKNADTIWLARKLKNDSDPTLAPRDRNIKSLKGHEPAELTFESR
jgi:hypothetical protein